MKRTVKTVSKKIRMVKPLLYHHSYGTTLRGANAAHSKRITQLDKIKEPLQLKDFNSSSVQPNTLIGLAVSLLSVVGCVQEGHPA